MKYAKNVGYATRSLSEIINNFITKELIDIDWEVVAIDPIKDKVVFRCVSEEKTSQPISELDLSHRIRICFEILNIKTIADITEHTAREFYIMRNIGKKSFKRIERILKDNGLEFKPRTHRR